jgi:copper chaperone NosL
MFITDDRFVTQVVTTKGKAYKFDSIECMVEFLAEGSLPADQIHSAWVSDYNEPGKWIKAEEARYLQSVNIRSPMGANLAAFSSLQDLEDAKVSANGLERRYADLPGVLRDAGWSSNHSHEHMFENLQGGAQSGEDHHDGHGDAGH